MRSAAGQAVVLLLLATRGAAQDPGVTPPPSPWYLERGTAVRAADPADEIPDVALLLAAGLRDGGVPGFYDGQFASTAGRVDELAAVAGDPDMHHVLRVMAVMALQEAASGARVAEALQPLLLAPEQEFGIEYDTWQDLRSTDDPYVVRVRLAADLSQHARFALAKDGQPEAVLAKLRVMQDYVQDKLPRLLDPSTDSQRSLSVDFGRQVIFDIGYHYQQFDDFEHAAEWFSKLCDNLPGKRETRWAHYNLACIAAIRGDAPLALKHLRSVYAVGFTDVAWMVEDGDLVSLRDLPEFRALAAEMGSPPPGGNVMPESSPDTAAAPDQGERTDSP